MKRALRIILLFLATITVYAVVSNKYVKAQETDTQVPTPTTYKGLVLDIVDEGTKEIYGTTQQYVVYKIRILNGDKKGNEVEVTSPIYDDVTSYEFSPGNKVLLFNSVGPSGEEQYFITDYLRTSPMIFLAIIFSVLIILISKKWGISSLISLAFSFLVIFKFMLPRLAAGSNPVFITIVGSIIIIPVTFYLSHGLNKKTTIALISTVVSLIITGLLAAAFMKFVNLTGYGTEEAFFLQYAKNEIVNIKGLLLAGIILGTLGVLNDVTISQVSTVFQIKKANKKMTEIETFHKAMKDGHDHITSMVNTLVFVYTGAALPLFLLFINSPVSSFEIINSEIIAKEIIRTLVGSIGLILAIPISTLIASRYYISETK